ncbi:STAS domain-containing protein [Streptomyces sp. NEAU-W12]|uniref:STAS domain-containing protein n=1 Tax=Streptomyces sp. NEAU-W12 TaxID=2994668 RepID=UPI00224B3B86|nr:STAS domain-containing protein [Streptomyces sp. NEAU-W12]MCX2924995.1 STAS domain-containing protein [Streptomyces sp. NEAU-W12]
MSENHGRPAAEPAERVVAGTTGVAPRGELDLPTAPVPSRRLDALAAGVFPDLVLDLRGVPFVDCSGLHVLCRARGPALSRGGRLRLVTRGPGLLRILHHTRLAGVFALLPRLPAELDAAAVGPAAGKRTRSLNSAP